MPCILRTHKGPSLRLRITDPRFLSHELELWIFRRTQILIGLIFQQTVDPVMKLTFDLVLTG